MSCLIHGSAGARWIRPLPRKVSPKAISVSAARALRQASADAVPPQRAHRRTSCGRDHRTQCPAGKPTQKRLTGQASGSLLRRQRSNMVPRFDAMSSPRTQRDAQQNVNRRLVDAGRRVLNSAPDSRRGIRGITGRLSPMPLIPRSNERDERTDIWLGQAAISCSPLRVTQESREPFGGTGSKICYPYRRQHFRLETAPICSHLLVEWTLLAPLLLRAPGVGSVSFQSVS